MIRKRYSGFPLKLDARVTRFMFSAAISKSLELKRSLIPLQKAQSNSEKLQQSKLEKLHPQCVKTGLKKKPLSNCFGLSKELSNCFLTQGTQKWQLVKVGSAKNTSILLHKGSFFCTSKFDQLPFLKAPFSFEPVLTHCG